MKNILFIATLLTFSSCTSFINIMDKSYEDSKETEPTTTEYSKECCNCKNESTSCSQPDKSLTP